MLSLLPSTLEWWFTCQLSKLIYSCERQDWRMFGDELWRWLFEELLILGWIKLTLSFSPRFQGCTELRRLPSAVDQAKCWLRVPTTTNLPWGMSSRCVNGSSWSLCTVEKYLPGWELQSYRHSYQLATTYAITLTASQPASQPIHASKRRRR
jgi:hypothetical protein